MKVSLVILAVLLVTGAVLWLHEKRWRRRHAGENEPKEDAPAEQCCGMHITCESVAEKIVLEIFRHAVLYVPREPRQLSL